jgi:hypothetical protein
MLSEADIVRLTPSTPLPFELPCVMAVIKWRNRRLRTIPEVSAASPNKSRCSFSGKEANELVEVKAIVQLLSVRASE